MVKTSYVVAIGSNRRHHRHGDPRHVVAAAAEALAAAPRLRVIAVAPIFTTPALGPAGRNFANGAVLLRSSREPEELLAYLKAIERDFGRRRARRWGSRVLDLDIILWSEGVRANRKLSIPHPAFRKRRFVLDPLEKLVPNWRDPHVGLSIRHLRTRLIRPKPVDRGKSAA